MTLPACMVGPSEPCEGFVEHDRNLTLHLESSRRAHASCAVDLAAATEMIDKQRDAISQLRARIGNAVEVLDSIRAILRGQTHPDDAERVVEMVNGFLMDTGTAAKTEVEAK